MHDPPADGGRSDLSLTRHRTRPTGRITPRRIALSAIALGVVAGIAVATLQPPPTQGLLGRPAPDVTLPALDGRELRLADYRGRPIVLNFWASWCVPCRDEFPLFVGARGEHVDAGLEILGIIRDDAVEAAQGFALAQGATWPLADDPDEVAWRAYGGVGVPMTFFIDRSGVVRDLSLGPVTEAGLKRQLATILDS